MAEILFVYITCADLEEARRIGRTLVNERLAACVNIRAHETIYRWQGKVEQGPEVGMLVKSTRDRYPAIESRVRNLHSYTLPCIVAWAPSAGLGLYLEWIAESVS
jgi:periplasmic divalent cation tolerance protein